MSEHVEYLVQITSCLVEALADEDGRIDLKCFEKICNAFIKAVLVAGKVGDQAVIALKQVFQQVGPIFSIGDAFPDIMRISMYVCR